LRDKLDDAVPTGGTHVYVWPVPERAGPAEGRQADVDREFVVAFAEMNENESWYIEDNVRTYAEDPDAVPIYRGPFGDVLVGAGIDWGKNFMESMNGFLLMAGMQSLYTVEPALVASK
jgi:hypothetical protein